MTRTKLRASLTEQAASSLIPGGVMTQGLIDEHVSRCRRLRGSLGSEVVIALADRIDYLQRHSDEGWKQARRLATYRGLDRVTEQAAQLVEREACRVCAKADVADAPILGHAECWRLVKLAREIRKLVTK